ncbi:MAG: trimeric intracellular cation channel family protein, partial [Steroidobacteraceae bacterium]
MPPRTITAQEARVSTLLLVLDLAGTFVFALAGATAGVRRRLDVFGVAVLSFATACSGGIARDVLIGAVPPAALSDWRYAAASLVAGALVFRWHSLVERLQSPV